jgi:hypothetical protein
MLSAAKHPMKAAEPAPCPEISRSTQRHHSNIYCRELTGKAHQQAVEKQAKGKVHKPLYKDLRGLREPISRFESYSQLPASNNSSSIFFVRRSPKTG